MSTNTNKESKGILAKLLATEGISVTHSPEAETAMFDVKNRQLILPVWKDMTDDIYDMLVGHEVGHALFTPYDQEKESKITPKGPWNADAQEIGGDSHGHIAMAYLNIIEDARIEKLMKIKYPGLRRDFVSAYAKLDARDFFGAHEKAPTYFIDRINLHFKMGVSAETTLGVQFSPKEQVFVDRIAAASTYDDVVQITKDVWEYEIENSNDPTNSPQYVRQEGEGEGNENGSCKKKDGKGDSKKSSGIEKGNGGKSLCSPAMPETHNKYLESCKDLVDENVSNVDYVSMPVPNLKNIIITPKEIEHIVSSYKPGAGTASLVEMQRAPSAGAMSEARDQALVETNKFIRSSNKSVAVLVKQFEMKKAADAHKRSATAKTGMLDTVKMMKYRFDDDIFLRSLTVRDGKNHGIVMFVDWSSSMGNIIDDTVKQCFLIALFCKKCNIPFDVYAFSSVHIRADLNLNRRTTEEWDDCSYDSKAEAVIASSCWSTKDGTRLEQHREELAHGQESNYMAMDNFSLLHFVSSKMSMKEMTSAMTNMLQITSGYGRSSRNSYYMTNPALRLSGTPLNECVLAATDIVNRFRKENNIQIVSTIMLTDGEGGGCGIASPSNKRNSYIVDERKKLTHNVNKIISEQNKIQSNTQSYRYRFIDTKVLLRIHAKETGSNVLGFYLNESSSISGRALESFLSNPTSYINEYSLSTDQKKLYKDMQLTEDKIKLDMISKYKKEGYFVAEPDCRMGGYKELYVIRGSAMIESENELTCLDGLDNGSSVATVRSAFRKQMKDSAISKNLLNRIIDNICV